MALMLRRKMLAILAVLTLSPALFAEDAKPVLGDPETALARYVARPEPVYGWELKEKAEGNGVTIYKLELTSQTWQNIVWKHALYVYEPQDVKFQDHAILFVSGGSDLKPPSLDEQLLGVSIANMSGGRVAMLKQVPNQPLFDGRVEDDLITETWLRYLQSGDDTWPLLFPMVKSAAKAMDAVKELGEKEGWPAPVEKFLITGASKRGWTSWLTAVADPRIVATAPCVIDTLNFRAQMRYQLESWGKFSEQIDDYSSKGLIRTKDDEETPRETALRTMMDPWTYRAQITVPKLIINGTNDRYWVVDAAKNYFGDLVGPKYVLQIPNAGHNLKGGIEKVAATIAVLFRHVASGTPMPQVEWTFTESESGERRLTMKTDVPAESGTLWMSTSGNNDFRESQWTNRPLKQQGDAFELAVPAAPGQGVATFGELRFVDRTIEPAVQYSLTTTVKRYAGTETAASP